MGRPVFIFDPYTDGHHDYYNGLLIDGLLDAGYEVCLLTSQDIEGRDSYRRWKSLEPDLRIIILKDRTARNKGAKPWQFQEIHHYIKEFNPVHIYVQLLDALVLTTLYSYIKYGHGFAAPWSALYVLPKYQLAFYGQESTLNGDKVLRLKEWVRFRMLKLLTRDPNLVGVNMIDDVAVDYYNHRLNRKICTLIADPVPEMFYEFSYNMDQIRKDLKFQQDDFIYLGYGFHNDRKGTHHLVRAFIQLKQLPEYSHAKLVIAGPIASQQVEDLLDTNLAIQLVSSGDLIVMNRHLNQEESLRYFRISDCVCVPYINHVGSSGVMLRALVLGKQVIATNQNWVGRLLSAQQLGILCDQDSTPALLKAMEEAYHKEPEIRAFANGDFFKADHFVQGLMQNLTAV
ncbi:glycosyltransferase [Candidatus Neomarinimicrobiota bacterium]